MKQKFALMLLAGTLMVGAAYAEVYARIPPPPPMHRGVIGVAPSPNHVWVNGYHEWVGGNYIWRPGYWVARPYPRAFWVDARWVPRRGGWVFVPGHWVRR